MGIILAALLFSAFDVFMYVEARKTKARPAFWFLPGSGIILYFKKG